MKRASGLEPLRGTVGSSFPKVPGRPDGRASRIGDLLSLASFVYSFRETCWKWTEEWVRCRAEVESKRKLESFGVAFMNSDYLGVVPCEKLLGDSGGVEKACSFLPLSVSCQHIYLSR